MVGIIEMLIHAFNVVLIISTIFFWLIITCVLLAYFSGCKSEVEDLIKMIKSFKNDKRRY